MRYYVTVGAETFEVVIDGDIVKVNGEAVDAALVQVPGTPVRRLTVDGRSQRLVAESGDERGVWDLHLLGHRLMTEVVDERTHAIRSMTGKASGPKGPKPVRAPMPGMVVRVEVAAGDVVRAGQGVVIIEAMKMENELKAEAAGTVAKVLVEAGKAVEKGAVLIEFAHG